MEEDWVICYSGTLVCLYGLLVEAITKKYNNSVIPVEGHPKMSSSWVGDLKEPRVRHTREQTKLSPVVVAYLILHSREKGRREIKERFPASHPSFVLLPPLKESPYFDWHSLYTHPATVTASSLPQQVPKIIVHFQYLIPGEDNVALWRKLLEFLPGNGH